MEMEMENGGAPGRRASAGSWPWVGAAESGGAEAAASGDGGAPALSVAATSIAGLTRSEGEKLVGPRGGGWRAA